MSHSISSHNWTGNRRQFILLLLALALIGLGLILIHTGAPAQIGGIGPEAQSAPDGSSAFKKTGPANGASSQAGSLTLEWAAIPAASRYEYCLDTLNNNSCDKTWISAGALTNVTLTGLLPGAVYYWQVRAINPEGTAYANGNKTAWWHFTINRPAGGQWTLVWKEEFNGSGALSATKWKSDLGKSVWDTGEIETMTNSLNNVFQQDGVLHIRAVHQGSNPVQGWTSGRVETVRTDFAPPAGGGLAIESRLKLSKLKGAAAQGYWPAFWTLGESCRGARCDWPKVGEVDILENINGQNTWLGFFHCGVNPGGPCNEPAGLGGSSSAFSPDLHSDYHIYRLEFDKSSSPEQLRWYVDGALVYKLDSKQFDAATWKNATGHGVFILYDLAIGGELAGNPTKSTASGGSLLVDYLHVFVRSGH
jgi:beta-glucanase (GH16 family)